ncbi:hypothetical protein LJB86_05405, partial [Deltaproteobacteria bacterium OttesenSCG-928-M10]|nr:hypothetical protein [Deltaproteobacteria bacterium OttesenSCG-928-M10]
HNQGLNPPDFDYGFNLEYGREYTSARPLLAKMRHIIDETTARKAAERPDPARRNHLTKK